MPGYKDYSFFRESLLAFRVVCSGPVMSPVGSDPTDTKYCFATSGVPSVSKFHTERCFQCAGKKDKSFWQNNFKEFK